jgi:DinB superfamily
MTSDAPNQKSTPPPQEPWLRGTLADHPASQRAVLHALELAREDVDRWCGGLTDTELLSRPHGLPPVAFHLRHIVGSLDRLLTYAEGNTLSDEQKRSMAAETDFAANREELFAAFESGLLAAESRIRRVDALAWSEPRSVGRKQLPTTVAGLLIHCADHTQRHVGQAVTTAKVVMDLREQKIFATRL